MAHGLVRRESVETEMHKSEANGKTSVYTKRKGYDVTRNPHLNKVGVRGGLGEFPPNVSENNRRWQVSCCVQELWEILPLRAKTPTAVFS